MIWRPEGRHYIGPLSLLHGEAATRARALDFCEKEGEGTKGPKIYAKDDSCPRGDVNSRDKSHGIRALRHQLAADRLRIVVHRGQGLKSDPALLQDALGELRGFVPRRR